MPDKKPVVLGAALSIYIPSNRIPRAPNSYSPFKVLKQAVAKAAGGYSIEYITGGYIMDDGTLVEEDVTVLTVRCASKEAEDTVAAEFAAFTQYLIILGEESVLVVQDQSRGALVFK